MEFRVKKRPPVLCSLLSVGVLIDILGNFLLQPRSPRVHAPSPCLIEID